MAGYTCPTKWNITTSREPGLDRIAEERAMTTLRKMSDEAVAEYANALGLNAKQYRALVSEVFTAG